jgi:hypothetical protein
MSKDEGRPLLHMTDDQLTRLIDSLRQAPPPPEATEEEKFKAIEKMAAERPLFPEFKHGRVKSRTGATFVPRIVASRTHPKGRVVDLLEYQYPDGVDVPQDMGGLAPTGMAISHTGEGGFRYTTRYKQWRYETFYRKDLTDYVGSDASALPPAIETPSKAAE